MESHDRLVQVGGAGNVALSSALSVAPLVATAVLVVALPRACRSVYRWPTSPHHGPWVVLAVIGLWLGAYFATLFVFALTVLLIGGAAIRGVLARRHGNQESAKRTNFWRDDVLVVAFLAGLLVLTLLETSYLPTERIDTPSTQPFTGFVVGERDDSTLVLRRGEGIEAYETSSLTRELCGRTEESALRRPLVRLFDE